MTLSWRLEIPVRLRLYVNAEKLQRAVGSKVARHVKNLMLSGRVPGGQLRLPKHKGSAFGPMRPMHRTGQLIKSIRYQKAKRSPGGYVGPSGLRTADDRLHTYRRQTFNKASKSWRLKGERYTIRRRNYAVYAMLIAQELQPGLETDEFTAALMSQTAERELARQLKRREAGLMAEMKTIKRRGFVGIAG